MATKSHEATVDELQAIIDNAVKALPAGVTLAIHGALYSGSDVAALAKQFLAAERAVVLAAAGHKDALNQRKALRSKSLPLMQAMRSMLGTYLANDHATLASLGIVLPRKRRALTSEQKLLKAERIRATRMARGTKGKRQRQKITGNVTDVVITTTRRDDNDVE